MVQHLLYLMSKGNEVGWDGGTILYTMIKVV